MRDPYRKLAAGVVCAGFEPYATQSQLESVLHDLPLAGFVLFERNAGTIENARAQTDTLRELYDDLAPIIAIDQEGGRVARLKHGNVTIPSAMAIAATGEPELARRAAVQLGRDLRRAGCNLDFAPVLDLALYPENTVIGTRAFSSDPQIVIQFASAFADGLTRTGIVPTFKHFPGHGSTADDSHFGLPVVKEAEASLRRRDLLPFATLLPQAAAAMSAHVVVRAFDRERPATLSPRVLDWLLRRELQFKGVCFTDCMQMDAIAKTSGTEEGSVLALVAGADCILLSNGLGPARAIVEAIEVAVDSGRLPLARLEQAFARVNALRRSLSPPLALESPPLDPHIGEEIERRATRPAPRRNVR